MHQPSRAPDGISQPNIPGPFEGSLSSGRPGGGTTEGGWTESATIRWLTDPRHALMLTRLALLGAVLLVALSEGAMHVRDRRRREALWAATQAESQGAGARQARWVEAIERWVEAEARLEGEELVDDALKAPGALSAMAGGEWAYLRGVADELSRPGRRLQAARASSHDAFTLCLRRPPEGDDRSMREAQETYRLHGLRFEEAMGGVEPVGELLFALRPMLRSWPEDVRQAEGALGLTLLERELSARSEPLRARARAASELRHLVLVIDRGEQVAPVAAGRGVTASMQPSRLLELEYLPHEAQVTVLDMIDDRPLLRLRRRLDERPLLGRDARVSVGWVQSCRLALSAHQRVSSP